MSALRYAVYWAPEPEHPLWQAGCAWLGRNPARPGAMFPMREATAEPRRYGFHATLKAPMALRGDADAPSFLAAVSDLAATLQRFAMPVLAVDWFGDFLALRPVQATGPSDPLRRLADACVRELDPWRAKPSERSLEQRLATGELDHEQRGLLRRWGAIAAAFGGPIAAPVNDLITGLPLIQLPAGFSYKSHGWRGDLMADGLAAPSNHDGMGVVRSRRVGRTPTGNTGYQLGGTTNIVFRDGNFVQSFASFGGTRSINSQAGNATIGFTGPESYALMLAGLGLLGYMGRRRTRPTD